jgi:hypothetical protein
MLSVHGSCAEGARRFQLPGSDSGHGVAPEAFRALLRLDAGCPEEARLGCEMDEIAL